MTKFRITVVIRSKTLTAVFRSIIATLPMNRMAEGCCNGCTGKTSHRFPASLVGTSAARAD
jgi:hypothetical protein